MDVTDKDIDSSSAEAAENSSADDTSQTYGCSHYKRKCSLVAPCCGKTYMCRLCHNDAELHEIDRRSVVDVVCNVCDTKQPVSNECVSCMVQFGRYFCRLCRLYDDDVDKGQFHCDLCGMCRVGGKENFFHCLKCDLCLSIHMKDSHKCVEKVAHSNCPVCLDHLHTSTHGLSVLQCGHVTHKSCWMDLLKHGNYACPLCCHSTVDMTNQWQYLDEEVAATQMPDEYRDMTVWVLCRDCHKKCSVPFHVVGLKCVHCGSYNTCLDSEPADAEAAAESAIVTQAHGDDDHSSAGATVPHEGTGDGVDMNME